jgi:hypothetical protein
MASPKIRIKRTAVPGKFPTVEQLDLGELAINTFEGKLFLKQNQNGTESIVDVGSLSSLAGNDGEFQFNDNGVYGASPNLTWDGFNVIATDLRLEGTLTANGSTGSPGNVLATTGSGVQWVEIPGLSLFPTGDYNAGADPLNPLENTVDAFGVSTIAFWDMMGPEGRIYQVDLETSV